MLYDIFYILTPQSVQAPVTTVAGNVLVLQTDASAASLEGCFKVASELPAHVPFCLYVQNTVTLTPDAAAAVTAFFFFTNYHTQQRLPLVLWDTDRDSPLQQAAVAQGFEKVILLAPSLLAYTAANAGLIQQQYRTMLQAAQPTTAALYITVAGLPEVAAVNALLAAEENRFEQESQALYLLKQQNRALQAQALQWERVALAAQQEIANQKEHNNILRSSSQATALQNYYNNEYEVLPLWFKRLGHIVKVLTGKRSVKSLYNDNVKKYKE